MGTFSNVGQYSRAIEAGKYSVSSFRKVPAQPSAAGIWVDLSMTPGNPVPNYYAAEPLVAKRLDWYKGILHAGTDQYLHRFLMHSATAAAVPSKWILLDYLLYYPFIDMDSSDNQPLDNSVALDRYQDGAGVSAMLVAVGASIAPGTFTMTYTNSAGQSGRVSPVCNTNSATNIGSIVTSGGFAGVGGGPWIPLASGDAGIRSVQSITFSVPAGGLASLVLAKPLLNTKLAEILAASEVELVRDRPGLPVVKPTSYLNLIGWPNASLAAAPIVGLAEFTWS